jgi:hypothetical protein
MKDLDLNPLRERVNATTAGVWSVGPFNPRPCSQVTNDTGRIIAEVSESSEEMPNGTFIAAAREDILLLIDEVTKLRAIIAAAADVADSTPSSRLHPGQALTGQLGHHARTAIEAGADALTLATQTRPGLLEPAQAEYLAALVITASLPTLTRAFGDPDDGPTHIIEFTETGWTIQHPIACRPTLFTCPVNQAAQSNFTGPPPALGRYECDVNDLGDRVLIYDRVDQDGRRV